MVPQQGNLFGNQTAVMPMHNQKACRTFFRDHTGRFAGRLTAEADNARHKASMYKRMWQSEVSRNKGMAKRIRQMNEEIYRLKTENELLRNEY